MDNLLEIVIDVDRDIKEKKSINPKAENQVSLTRAQGSEFKRSFEKKPIKNNALRYPLR